MRVLSIFLSASDQESEWSHSQQWSNISLNIKQVKWHKWKETVSFVTYRMHALFYLWHQLKPRKSSFKMKPHSVTLCIVLLLQRSVITATKNPILQPWKENSSFHGFFAAWSGKSKTFCKCLHFSEACKLSRYLFRTFHLCFYYFTRHTCLTSWDYYYFSFHLKCSTTWMQHWIKANKGWLTKTFTCKE